MPLADNRAQYSWRTTRLTDFSVLPEKRRYSLDETVIVSLGFRVVGGLRDSYTPEVWTTAWEENDKLIRLMMSSSVRTGLLSKSLASTGREVRKARFYWSRDPDLPYRIWSLVVPEDGTRPVIPLSVDDAKAKLFDVNKRLEFQATSLGRGKHRIAGAASLKWGRRSYIEKGSVSGKSREVELTIE